MSLFGAIVKTAVNVVKLPVSLPIAVAKDAVMFMDPDREIGSSTKQVVREIKEDADG